MSKTSPQERWQKHVMERYAAFKLSGEIEKLRAEGLKILGRNNLFVAEEWNATFTQRASSEKFLIWYEKCKTVGERFGLGQCTVELACLYKGYKPEELPFVMESDWPRIIIITEVSDPVFLKRLAYEAQKLGTQLVQRRGSVEISQIYINTLPFPQEETPTMPDTMPPVNSALRARVETPIGYPPEGISQLTKEAARLEKVILSRLGYHVSLRLRNSPLVPKAYELKMNQKHLASGGSYDIIDNMFEDDLSQDQKRRKLIKSRRYKLGKRLIEPYTPEDNKSAPD